MAETLANYETNDGSAIEAVKYDGGAHHLYETDAQGNKRHLGSDEFLRGMGYNPNQRTSPNPEPAEAEPQPELDTLRQELAQQREEAERRHQELLAAMTTLTEQITALLARETLPPPSAAIPQTPLANLPPGTNAPWLSGERAEQSSTPQERLEAAEAAMETARNNLVDLTIRRRARAGDGLTDARREDHENYDTAMTAYREAVEEYLRARAAVLEIIDPNNPDAALDEVAIQRQLLIDRFNEQLAFKEVEFTRNNDLLSAQEQQRGLHGLKARMIRRWSNYSTTKKLMIGLGVGLATALASGTLGAGLAVLAGGSAAKFSLGLLRRSASARNVSQKSYDSERARVERARDRSLLHFDEDAVWAAVPGGQDIDRETHIGAQAGGLQEELDRDVVRAQRRNRFGNALMLVGAGGVAYGVAELAGANHLIPSIWDVTHHHDAAPKIDWSRFHPNQFYGRNSHEAVTNMFGVLQQNHIQATNLTPDKINAIAKAMENGHWHLAYGVDSGAHQHILDTAQGWAGGSTANAHASALEGLRQIDGSSTENWTKFVSLARQQGVNFTQGATG